MRRLRNRVLNITPTVRVEELDHSCLHLLWVFHVPHLCEGVTIPAQVLKEVSILMKNGTDHHLNGVGVVTENEDGISDGIIHTIGGGETVPQCADRIGKGPTLGLNAKICFAPFNCFAHHTTDLRDGHCLSLGLQVYHTTKIRIYNKTNKTTIYCYDS